MYTRYSEDLLQWKIRVCRSKRLAADPSVSCFDHGIDVITVIAKSGAVSLPAETDDLPAHFPALEIVHVMTAVITYHFRVCLFSECLFVFDPYRKIDMYLLQ